MMLCLDLPQRRSREPWWINWPGHQGLWSMRSEDVACAQRIDPFNDGRGGLSASARREIHARVASLEAAAFPRRAAQQQTAVGRWLLLRAMWIHLSIHGYLSVLDTVCEAAQQGRSDEGNIIWAIPLTSVLFW